MFFLKHQLDIIFAFIQNNNILDFFAYLRPKKGMLIEDSLYAKVVI